MEQTGTRRKSKKQGQLDAELGLIIDEMGRAMWNSNKYFIAQTARFTLNIELVMDKFRAYCRKYYSEKA